MTVQATAVWRVRPSGSNTNGGGYDAGLAGAATDYSQQNAAQATGTHGSATGTTTFTDATALAFTSAMVGNAMYITGGGLTTGFYFITGFTSSSIVTLDRTPGTGTLATWNLGGGWADFWTNTTSALNYIVPGNTIFILGSGTPNPAAYTFDYSYTSASTTTFVAGSLTGGYITFANDPGTPGYLAPPNTTGGMPCISISFTGGSPSNIFTGGYEVYSGLWIVASGTIPANSNIMNGVNGIATAFGSVCDQNTNDIICFYRSNIIGCELFSSVAPGSPGVNYAVLLDTVSNQIINGCNIHDCVGGGINSVVSGGGVVVNSIIAKNRVDGFKGSANVQSVLINNTIDGNLGNGITLGSNVTVVVVNNIISNHTQGGKFGISGVNKPYALIDYNIYYNNTANYNNVPAGPHDTALGSNPYVGQATENYKLA